MTHISKYLTLMLLAVLLDASPAPSAQQYYAQSLAVMRALPQPANVTVSVSAVGDGIGIYAGPSKTDPKYATVLAGSAYSRQSALWTESYDSASDSAVVDMQDAHGLIGEGPLYDPTWYGAYDWLRYGFSAPAHAGAPHEVPSSQPQFKTIATLTIMAPGAYRISDAGAQPCPDGSAGHHLQFAAKGDWTQHPLTDITIDERTLRFCAVRFRLDPEHVRGGTATVELDYANVEGYWLQTHTHADFLARLFGIGVHHFGLDLIYRVTQVR